jgi:hypothetical protein
VPSNSVAKEAHSATAGTMDFARLLALGMAAALAAGGLGLWVVLHLG